MYKSLLNLKKRSYKCAISNKLTNSIHDSNLFWKQIRNSQYRCRVPDVISPNVWLRHFQRVFSSSEPPSTTNVDNQTVFVQELPHCDTTILNVPIDATEIVNAIRHLKTGKAPGADMIMNEMMKCSVNQLLPYLLNLFNAIFDKGVYPTSWEESVIIPLHK